MAEYTPEDEDLVAVARGAGVLREHFPDWDAQKARRQRREKWRRIWERRRNDELYRRLAHDTRRSA